MGNKYTQSYEPKEYFDNIKRCQYKTNEFNKLMEKLILFNSALKANFKFDDDYNFNNNIKDIFLKKYGLFLGIERFFIPIIGIINSGKSTFMNNFLNLKNILQIGDITTTRFMCIIRHDKNAKVPELYNVKIEKRNENGYNFKEKGVNLLKINDNKSVSQIIENLNNDIKKNENSQKYITNPENYFLIVKTNVPIFEGEFEEYGNLIDFIDMPGLDEIKENGTNIFDDFIQIIFSNILFPLFIFDVQTFEDDNAKNILIKYLDYYYSVINIYNFNENNKFDKGIFILNKIDLLNEDIKEIKKEFEKVFSSIVLSNGKELIIQLKYENNYFGISAKQLFTNGNNSFLDNILDDIIKESKNSNFNSFKKFIKNYFLTKYKIDLTKANEENENLNEQLKIINDILKNKCKNLNNPQFTLKEYTYLSKQNKNKNKDIEDCNQKIIKCITEKIKNEIEIYLNFDFEGLIDKININEIENKNKILNNKKFDSDEFVLDFNEKVQNLFAQPIKKEYKKIREIIDLVEDFKKYYISKRIRILFIGKISSGKTSLLNSIIGHNYYILETTMKECTKCIFIIKYSKNISLCESILVHNQYGSYFEDKEETRQIGLENIKKTIKNLNEESSYKYYTLYIPIEALENFRKKEEIELIDLPGIKQSLINDEKIDLKDLINLSDGFIFSFNSVNLDDESSHFIMTELIDSIKSRSDNFDFNNCLFNLNYIDEIDDNLIEEKVNKFKKDITKKLNDKIYSCNFRQKLSLREKILSCDDINVSYFSNKYYQQYQENINSIETMDFIKKGNSLEQIYEDLIEDYEDMQAYILEHLDKNKINKRINIIKNTLSIQNDNEYIIKISKFIEGLLQNKKHLSKYISSKANIFFDNFNNQILLSQINNNKNKSLKLNIYLVSILFKLFYINELCLNEERINDYKKNIEIKKGIIEKEYNEIVKIIENKFSDKLKIIDEYQNKALSSIISEEKLSKEEIFENIKSLGIDKKINALMKNLDNEIKKIQFEFYYFCIKKITEILTELSSFQEILEIVSVNYKKKIGKDAIVIGSISAGIFGISAIGLGIATTAGVITFMTIGALAGGSILILALPGLVQQLIKRNQSNKENIKDYFKDIKNNIDKIKKKYIDSTKIQKKGFLSELENSKGITLNEIRFLKNNNYQAKFKELLDIFI